MFWMTAEETDTPGVVSPDTVLLSPPRGPAGLPSCPVEEGETQGIGAFGGEASGQWPGVGVGGGAKGQLGGPLFSTVPEPEAGIAFRASSALRVLRVTVQEPWGCCEKASVGGCPVNWCVGFLHRGPAPAQGRVSMEALGSPGTFPRPRPPPAGRTLGQELETGCLSTGISQGEESKSGGPRGVRSVRY